MKNEFLSELNLLYVEDEEKVRELLAPRLERAVNNLYVAKDGEDGYLQYSKFKPDLILTDISMPKLNGIEMSKKIREENLIIPIIMLSAHSDTSFLLDAIEYGITDYLTKPINKQKLFDTLEKNAKVRFLDKINLAQQNQIKQQQSMLQTIIDNQQNICFVTDFNEITFANRAFLNFFYISHINEFNTKFTNVEDIFIEDKNNIHKTIVSDYENTDRLSFGKIFFNEINNINDARKIVSIKDKDSQIRLFYLNISCIEEHKNQFLINLTDITKMGEEKIVIEQKAYRDGLTNIFNRHKFDELFASELERVKRYKFPMSIAILDIDHFKEFNDNHGHLVGDEVLIMLSSNLGDKLRKTDVYARWGGEEFVILFIETKLDDAIISSNNIRKNIEQLEHKTAGKITVSFGVTQYQENDTLESLFKRCDDALYKAKENGRNRVESV